MYTGKYLSLERSGIIGKSRDYNDYCCLCLHTVNTTCILACYEYCRMFGNKLYIYIYEPGHNKTDKITVRLAKTQISLGIRPVWSESSLSAWRKLGSLPTHWAPSEDSDAQSDLSLRWAHSHFVCFVMSRLLYRYACFYVWTRSYKGDNV